MVAASIRTWSSTSFMHNVIMSTFLFLLLSLSLLRHNLCINSKTRLGIWFWPDLCLWKHLLHLHVPPHPVSCTQPVRSQLLLCSLKREGRKYNIKSPSSITFFRGTCYADLGLISRHSALPCECVLFECVCTPVCKSTQLQFNRMPPTPFAAKMTAWSWHHTSSSPPPLTYASIFHVHSSCWCGYRGYASDGRF